MNDATESLDLTLHNISRETIEDIDALIINAWKETRLVSLVSDAFQEHIDLELEEDPTYDKLSDLMQAFVDIGRHEIDWYGLTNRWMIAIRDEAELRGEPEPFDHVALRDE